MNNRIHFDTNPTIQQVVSRVVREYEAAGHLREEIFTEPLVAQVARVAMGELVLNPDTPETRHFARTFIAAELGNLA